jgi:filamin
LKDNGDGTYFCKYTPPCGGPYKVAIDLIGKPEKGESSGPIKGSVYSLQVREPSDPKNCWAEGPGLIKSFEGQPAYFTVHTRDKDGKPVPGDNVKCEVKLVEKAPDAPGGTDREVPVDVKDNNDGTYSVRYDPHVAGKYRVNVTVGDNQSIKDMPKMVNCYHPVDPKSSIARGPGVTPGEPVVGKDAPFAVIVKDKNGNTIPVGGHDLKVTVTGPSGPIPVDVKDENNGIYQCKYLPKEAGLHVVDVKLEGQGVKDNPFRIQIATPCDPSKCWAEGPGLHQAFDNRPAKFRVHAVDKNGKPVAGEPIEVKVIPKAGGKEAPVNVKDNGDGTYDVSYMADTPGKYMIHTNIQGKPIKDMPKEVTCYPGADASKSIVEGPGVTGGYVNTDLPFTIRSMDKNGKPVPVGGDEYKVNVTAPDGSSFPVDVKDNGDGTYSGKYRPTKVGDYKVMVNLNNQKAPVGKSPYTAKVRHGADPGKSFAVGRGWKEAWDCLPAKFTVHCKDVNGNPVPGEIVRIIMKNVTPPGKKAEIDKELGGMDDYLRRRKVEKVQKVQAEMKKAALDSKREAESKGERVPEVRIEEGSDVPVEVRDNGDGTYLAQYVATQPGIYKCHVQVGESRGHIKESPKDIPVYLSKPKVVFWKHTYDQQKKKLAAAEALLAKHGLSLGPDF